MKRNQFLRLLKDECDALGFILEIRRSEGKGSHYRAYVGRHYTIVKSGELSPGYMNVVRKQLGLKPVR